MQQLYWPSHLSAPLQQFVFTMSQNITPFNSVLCFVCKCCCQHIVYMSFIRKNILHNNALITGCYVIVLKKPCDCSDVVASGYHFRVPMCVDVHFFLPMHVQHQYQKYSLQEIFFLHFNCTELIMQCQLFSHYHYVVEIASSKNHVYAQLSVNATCINCHTCLQSLNNPQNCGKSS